jgi:hypothetical protein
MSLGARVAGPALIGATTAVLIALLVCFPGAALGHTRSTCRPANGFPDPQAEIISTGPSCARANRVLGRFFNKAQSHGSPVTVDGFRCRALPGEIECRRRRARIEYFGGM